MSNGITQGVWRKGERVSYGGSSHGFPIYFNDDGEQVVDFVYSEADADLICAAPDLYKHADALLADVMQRYGITEDGLTCPHMRGLAEALRKARGQ